MERSGMNRPEAFTPSSASSSSNVFPEKLMEFSQTTGRKGERRPEPPLFSLWNQVTT